MLLMNGLVKSLHIDPIKNPNIEMYQIQLSDKLGYYVYFTDPSLQFIAESPSLVPRAMLSIKQWDRQILVRLKVIVWIFLVFEKSLLQLLFQPIRHEILNQPDNPCEPDPEYNYAKCVEKNIIIDAGCQAPWRRVSVEGLPLCDNFTKLYSFFLAYENIWRMDRRMRNEKTQCFMPCSFMEYKVSQIELTAVSDGSLVLSLALWSFASLECQCSWKPT